MAKKSKNQRESRGLIEYLNQATSYQKTTKAQAKEEIEAIKRFCRNSGCVRKFSRLVSNNPDWVTLAENGVQYTVDSNCTEKGVFLRIVKDSKNKQIALIKVAM